MQSNSRNWNVWISSLSLTAIQSKKTKKCFKNCNNKIWSRPSSKIKTLKITRSAPESRTKLVRRRSLTQACFQLRASHSTIIIRRVARNLQGISLSVPIGPSWLRRWTLQLTASRTKWRRQNRKSSCNRKILNGAFKQSRNWSLMRKRSAQNYKHVTTWIWLHRSSATKRAKNKTICSKSCLALQMEALKLMMTQLKTFLCKQLIRRNKRPTNFKPKCSSAQIRSSRRSWSN